LRSICGVNAGSDARYAIWSLVRAVRSNALFGKIGQPFDFHGLSSLRQLLDYTPVLTR
jgi:hypothetical protein